MVSGGQSGFWFFSFLVSSGFLASPSARAAMRSGDFGGSVTW